MPQAEVKIPDGRTVTLNVPEGATQEQILGFTKQQFDAGAFPEPKETLKQTALRKGAKLSGAIAEDIGTRKEKLEQIGQAQIEGKFTAPQAVVASAGQGALLGLDVAGNVISELIPDPIEEALGTMIGKVVETVGKVQSGFGSKRTIGEDIRDELVENPEMALLLEGGIGLVALATPAATGSTLVGRTGQKIRKSAQKSKSKFASDLVKEAETPKVIEQASRQGRVSETPIRRARKIAPSKREKEITQVVSSLPINTKAGLIPNSKIIMRGIDNKAKKLIADLKKVKIIFTRAEVRNKIQRNLDEAIDEQAFLTGNAELTAEKVREIVFKELFDNPSTPAGLLEARKQIDRKLTSQTQTASGKTIFDSDAQKAVNVSIANIRQTINNIIAEKAPSVAVKKSLREQELLYSARNNISTKVRRQADTAYKRLLENIEKTIPLSQGFFVSVLANVAAPFVLTARGLSSVNAPVVRHTLGKLIEKADEAIVKTDDKILARKMSINFSRFYILNTFV